MKKFLLANWLLATLFCLPVMAQEVTVSGRVTSSDDGSALPGVSVQVKGTTRGTTTDANGNYKITTPANPRLVFSFIGYTSQEVEAGSRTTVNLTLQSSANELTEFIITGYGAAVTKKEATGATANIKGDAIENLPVQSFDRALQGRAAGVQITSSSGVPGGAVQVRIRGVGSITAGNDPLYVVDGVQINTRNDGGGNVSSNPLSFLNPNDIESIDVLKDAATAAIYGAQAANGVVLVTTKRGKAGAKTRVNINYYKGIVDPIRKLDVLSTQQFIQIRTEALQAARPTLTPVASRTLALSQLGLSTDLTDEAIAALPNYDWQGESYRPGSVDNVDLSAQGGNDRTTFYLSGSFNQQDASLRNVDFKRFSSKLNLTHKLNNKLAVDAGLNVSAITQRGPYGTSGNTGNAANVGSTTAFGAPQYAAPLILPFNPIYNPDGSYYGLPASGVTMVGDLSQNIVANSDLIKSKTNVNQLVGNLGLTYSLTKDLILKGFGGLDYRTVNSSLFNDPRTSDYYNVRGSLNQFVNSNIGLTSNVTANYTKTIGEKHLVSALIGAEYRQEINETTTLNASGFPTPDLNTANAAAEPVSVGGAWTGFKRAGIFTNVRYEYGKRYILSGILRYDGSSRFGTDNRWGYFPSISAKWNIAEESFLNTSNTISDLGLRFSVGSTGNDQVDNFAARQLYGLSSVYQGNSGIRPSQLGNSNLRWERNVTYNLGLDYGFFGGRIKGSFEAFHRTSRDLLLNRTVPSSNGVALENTNTNTVITENIGEVVNKGLEFDITTVNVNKGGFRWETNFNITLIDNKVTKLFEGTDVLPGNLAVRVGYPLFTNVSVPYAGVNPANGRPMWYDLNGDITYLFRTADQRPLGHSAISKIYGGFTNTLSYGGIELSALFQYDQGKTVQNLQEFRFADNGGVLRNSLLYYYENRWTTPGQITSVPRPAENRTEVSGRVSSYQQISRFYQDASYIRLKQITLSYNLPSSLMQHLKMSSVKIYAQSINALTWTKWTGFDPEFAGTDNSGIIPQSRSYTFGIQIGL
ncbi:SusC/RagA family TonB-linked outer membrane protein [Spirosoma validum]|uniref:TonB-dependent receptor n=1 Tax=Spirosoma validum TaxID=2771355 RepID=A0A927B7T5_9BACT|nr:TonB-dependent receptor [Spirosoma validum]MBD2756868.1 TonB-dependent receptor [Spirosoma validum]